MDVSPDELPLLYTWIDGIPLSRPKRNISRDFSDADKVFRRLHFSLTKEDIEAVASCEPQMIERILKLLKYKIAKYKPNGLSGDSDLAKDHLDGGHFHDPHSRSGGPQRDTLMRLAQQPQIKENGGRQEYFRDRDSGKRNTLTPSNMRASQDPYAPSRATSPRRCGMPEPIVSAKLEEKDALIRELSETIELLEAKVRKLEQLVRLKEHKIQVLSGKVPKFNGRA
ncbi:hypothetical protein CY35_05G060600 [Sphagnum magellanicum]|nr:hypothetical protein CY35_05G060600 [Sphagnum magellanicum]